MKASHSRPSSTASRFSSVSRYSRNEGPRSPVSDYSMRSSSKASDTSRTSKKRRRKRKCDSVEQNFKVVIRVRPPLKREVQSPRGYHNCVMLDDQQKSITLTDNSGHDSCLYNSHSFTFDHIYLPHDQQEDVYENTAKIAVLSTLQGYNATIMAYGQTGSGKTYTMEGLTGEFRGIIPRAVEEIFNFINQCAGPTMRFLVRASYLQIYNECISDLLKPNRTNLQIRESKRRGLYVEGLSEWVVKSPQEIFGLIKKGQNERATSWTKLNEISSRSHAMFIVIVEQNKIEMDIPVDTKAAAKRKDGKRNNIRQLFKVGKLNLVDLAGSERVRISGATGKRLEESKKINQSLSALGNVIASLTDKRQRTHVPYRDSKLTRILEDSLGGNCKTTMMAMISPSLDAFLESISTLKFANRAKNIKNTASINEDLDEKALLRRYEREVKRLRKELAEKNKNVVDKRRLLEIEEKAQRAERDKAKALDNLERLSHDLQREKHERKRLQQQIVHLNNQLVGSHFDEHFRSLLLREQEKIRRHYEKKLDEIEKEREQMEEDKTQSDRYKTLLIKQRDIMIQLTARLNERDQSILALQDELDAFEKQQRLLEDALDQKILEIVKLQKAALGKNDTKEENNNSTRSLHYSTKTPSYKPYAESDIIETNQNTHKEMLDADQKILELQRILEEKESEQITLTTQLEETQAEKVSLEYLLREKLEKMVQKEIEERVKIMEEEANKWRGKFEEAVLNNKNVSYSIEINNENGDEVIDDMHKKFNNIIEQERNRMTYQFEELISALKRSLQSREEELSIALGERKQLRRTLKSLQSASQNKKHNNESLIKDTKKKHKEFEAAKFLINNTILDHINNLSNDFESIDVPLITKKRLNALKRTIEEVVKSLNHEP